MRRALLLVSLLLFGIDARAEVPAFTPNVVDPFHHLDAAAAARVDDALAEMRRQADLAGAVYITNDLGDDSIETLANSAFNAWHLGEKGKDNGLLLVLAMNDHKMRIETGYGIEGDVPDVACQRALDSFVRPQMRAGHLEQAILDGLVSVARFKHPTFHIAADVHYDPPAVDQNSDFDASFGGKAWAIYLVLLTAIFAWRRALRSTWWLWLFFVVNPGVFVFIGASLLPAHREEVFATLHGLFSMGTVDGALAWITAHLVLVPFYAALVFAAASPVRSYVPRAVDLESGYIEGSDEVRALDEKLLKLTHGRRLKKSDTLLFEIGAGIGVPAAVWGLGEIFDLSYRTPLLVVAVPLAVLALFSLATQRALRRYATQATFSEYLRRRVREVTAQMEKYVSRGFAERHDDGTYSYTAAYYASQSSSSSSSFSSSSGGGSSGGGGASSSW